MRILHVTPAYKPAHRFGGPSVSIPAMAETMARKGNRVVVFTTNGNLDCDLDVATDRPTNLDGVEVWYFRRDEFVRRWLPFIPYFAKSSGFQFAPAMAPALEHVVPDVDVVHVHMPFVYPTLIAARAASRHGKPLFYSARAAFDPSHLCRRALKKRIYLRAVERGVVARSNVLVALTAAEASHYRSLGFENDCCVIPNGIHVARYRQSSATGLFGIAPEAQVVLFLGRLIPTKGLVPLLNAFSIVAAHNRRARLVIAGPDEAGMRESLESRGRALGLDGRVVFAGMVEGEDKIELLARADLFCLPSRAEGASVATLEALASATPVLLSPGCNFPDVVTADAGRVMDVDAARWAGAMTTMLNDEAGLRRMGANARSLVEDRYDWDRICDALLARYQTAIAHAEYS